MVDNAYRLGIILGHVIAFVLGMWFQQWGDTPRLNQCLPEDRCILHIEPKDQPWLNLTCDLNTGRCEDK